MLPLFKTIFSLTLKYDLKEMIFFSNAKDQDKLLLSEITFSGVFKFIWGEERQKTCK